jgi:hypothetical protein
VVDRSIIGVLQMAKLLQNVANNVKFGGVKEQVSVV